MQFNKEMMSLDADSYKDQVDQLSSQISGLQQIKKKLQDANEELYTACVKEFISTNL